MFRFVISHKHRFSHPYHQHGRENSLQQAIKSIQRHDRWQLNGRFEHYLHEVNRFKTVLNK